MWNLNVHETYTAENLAWQIENRAILLKKHRFYAELSLVFLGAEILSFGMLVFLSVKENKKK